MLVCVWCSCILAVPVLILPHIYTFFIGKKFVRKQGSNGQNLRKIIRKSLGSISAIKCSVGQKQILHHYYIQNVKGGNQIRVYMINKESVAHFS